MKDEILGIIQNEINKCDKISDFDDRLKCKSALLHEITEVQDVTNINILKDMDASLPDATTDPRWIPAHMVDNANAVILGITDGRFRPDIFWHTGSYVKEKMDSIISKQWLLIKDVPDSIKEKIKKRDEK
ncbi:MAG: hypothetical protein IMZ58_08545 [Thermoplasmata archaeon]|nr:hypothetical protein [Thermoplasmata archaeon]